MAGTAVLGRLTWRLARVTSLVDETPRVRSLFLEVPDWPGHRPGQHIDVRLTAEDGYSAQRSYSIATAPSDPVLGLTIERLDDGEVSPYLAGYVGPGDRFELRGPIGGYFVWDGQEPGPLLLVAGGSGIVPLMSMLRHRRAVGRRHPAGLLYSVRTREDLIYRQELDRLGEEDSALRIIFTLTREDPPAWEGWTGRIDLSKLARFVEPFGTNGQAFVCGPTGFVETAASLLLELNLSPRQIKTERFGPTGGGP